MKPLRVLVVDDSAVVRQMMTSILASPDFEVAVAADPLIALKKIEQTRPDVILLDLEMPRMDGLTFLKKLMRENPIPVVVCSALGGTESGMRALDEGAVEVITKPQLGTQEFLNDSAVLLSDALRAASIAVLRPPPAARPRLAVTKWYGIARTTDKVIAVGASTGGTEALRDVLSSLPVNTPGLVVVQHMPEMFTAAFAQRLDEECRINVKEAKHGDRILEGRALIAPGNKHLRVVRNGAHYEVLIDDGPLVSRHRPSVDVLFRSTATSAGPNALGIIMTGMGDDGAKGLLEMRRAGATTFAQDEASSVVFGMPKEAIKLGAAITVLSLANLPAAIVRWMRNEGSVGASRPLA